jgi:hypothetical protein
MSEELEQLLKNLKLRRMLEIYEEQLRAAEKQAPRLAARQALKKEGPQGLRALPRHGRRRVFIAARPSGE